jgi:hypothetical protein
MNFKLILFSIVLAGVGFGAVFYWEIKKQAPNPPPPTVNSSLVASTPITSFERQMLAKGYIRDHATHRWYSIWESAENNGCVEYGTPLETTFKCRTPLTDGIPDEK